MRKVKVALFGLGTVGKEVFLMLKQNPLVELENEKVMLEVVAVYVKDITKKRDIDMVGVLLTSDIRDILNQPQIEICIECMGGNGVEQTKEILEAAMRKGKHVVMSSKKCLAQNMGEFIKLSNQYNIQLRFEASAGGAIPICHELMRTSKENKVKRIFGIINATTNFVLTQMQDKKIDMSTALELAKEKGFAEQDAKEDLDGWDTLYKMVILARSGMQIELSCEQMKVVSLKNITEKKEIKNGITKQIFYIEQTKESLCYYVGPIQFKRDQILSFVKNSYNMIFTEYENSGLRSFYGKGAGGKETASVICDDIFDVLRQNYWFFTPVKASATWIDEDEVSARLMALNEVY